MKGLSLFANIGIGELTLPKKFQISQKSGYLNHISLKNCGMMRKTGNFHFGAVEKSVKLVDLD